MYWRHYTRERAAQDLLNVSNRLSHRSHVFRPIDPVIKLQTIEKLTRTSKKLSQIGYTNDSSALSSLTSALAILTSTTEIYPPFGISIRVSRLLLETVESLSISSSPFPVQNRQLPLEILRIIHEYVLLDPCPESRQDALLGLSATSILWHQIVAERPVFYFDSCEKLYRWNKRLKCPQVKRWEAVEIDLGFMRLRYLENRILGDILDQEPKIRDSTGEIVGKKCRLRVDLDTWLEDLGPGYVDWAEALSYELYDRPYCSVSLPVWTSRDYDCSLSVLKNLETEAIDEMELYLGQSDAPILLSTETLQGALDQRDNEIYSYPVFTSYSVLAVPWIVFTAPIFFLQTVQEPLQGPNPPSVLRHLELSFEVDPSNPVAALDEIGSFFLAISPQLEQLAFRLRITGPHPSSIDESNFTRHLVSSLSSCKRLQHLELGGFGCSRDLLPQLSTLSVPELVLLPLHNLKSCAYNLRERPPASPRVRRRTPVRQEPAERQTTIEDLCEVAGIWVSEDVAKSEWEMMDELMRNAGIV
ncbi:hypothetical protein JCM5350_000254 [Sporobolomyces pararoseus]